MSAPSLANWKSVRDEVLRRIHARDWAPGEMIPNEADLAVEFGCARATVNRALRDLADQGLLDRRRKAGTRVALHPVRHAKFEIPMIRDEIEARAQTYSYALLSQATLDPPTATRSRLGSKEGEKALHLRALHLADSAPLVLEDRWINLTTIPEALGADFTSISANEWLLSNAPYTRGDITFSATAADGENADALGVPEGAPVFTIDRITWNNTAPITSVRLIYAPGYQMHTGL